MHFKISSSFISAFFLFPGDNDRMISLNDLEFGIKVDINNIKIDFLDEVDPFPNDCRFK